MMHLSFVATHGVDYKVRHGSHGIELEFEKFPPVRLLILLALSVTPPSIDCVLSVTAAAAG